MKKSEIRISGLAFTNLRKGEPATVFLNGVWAKTRPVEYFSIRNNVVFIKAGVKKTPIFYKWWEHVTETENAIYCTI